MSKILLVGSGNEYAGSNMEGGEKGVFKQIISKVENLNKSHGPFELVFCLSSPLMPFDLEDPILLEYRANKKTIPVQTYFILGDESLSAEAKGFLRTNDGEICPNLTFLGKSGILKTQNGLQVAYLSGIYNQDKYDPPESEDFDYDEYGPFYTKADINSVLKKTKDSGFDGVDMLLTYEWPRDVAKFAVPPELKQIHAIGQPVIADLVAQLRPRYHFASKEPTYYERVPYRNEQTIPGKDIHVTRFFGMGPVLNKEKKKWIYAMNITPLEKIDYKTLIAQPPETTDSPFGFKGLKNESAPAWTDNGSFFFAGQPQQQYQGKRNRDQGRQHNDKRQKYENQDNSGNSGNKRFQPSNQGCWFCLANPQAEKHLVISVGEESYLALAKGGLIETNILIVPMEHHPNSLALPNETFLEINKYKTALKKAFKGRGQDVVFYETNFKSQHLIIQVVPIPEHSSSGLKEQFIDVAKENNILLQPESEVQMSATDQFFKVELPTGITLVHPIRGRFPAQLGRQVLSKVLGTPEKADWKLCVLDKEKESELVMKFRNFYKPFDFTLE